jgi:hypothetical protein
MSSSNLQAPIRLGKKMPASNLPAPIRLGIYKHKQTGVLHTVTVIEENIPFGTGADHRVWFTAPHMLEPKGWPQQQFLAEMSEEMTPEVV